MSTGDRQDWVLSGTVSKLLEKEFWKRVFPIYVTYYYQLIINKLLEASLPVIFVNSLISAWMIYFFLNG
ncbi:hypothetical protein LguiA_034880 [Lonicera macranthoides]